MKRLNDQELESRIQTFMHRKQREFPELHLVKKGKGEEYVEVIPVTQNIYKAQTA
jgi:hypothetical protein